ncbi:MAG: hypothetical protein SH859_07775 [Hyphomicrobium aestuarii]|nr:hypothetical protein [Hyphomicrobium aestuarii]
MPRTTPTPSFPEALTRISQLAERGAQESRDSRNLFVEILALLPVIKGMSSQSRSTAPERRTRRGEAIESYAVETTKNGMFLVEYRTNSQPFRCPQCVFDALVTVAAEIDVPLDFIDLLLGVSKELRSRDKIPDYQLRVAVRFLQGQQPPLLLRARSRYKPAASGFHRAAYRAWRERAAAGSPR